MTKIISIIIYFAFLLLFYWMVERDPEYKVLSKRDAFFEKRDQIEIFLYSIVWCILILLQPKAVSYLCAITLPYLTITEISDRITKMVYVAPYYIFMIVFFILDFCGIVPIARYGILFIFVFTLVMEKLHLVGGGDSGMIAVIGVIAYMKYQTIDLALLSMCFMILIASVIQYAAAIKKHNMDGPFKMKDPMAFGPALTFATLIMLILETIL